MWNRVENNALWSVPDLRTLYVHELFSETDYHWALIPSLSLLLLLIFLQIKAEDPGIAICHVDSVPSFVTFCSTREGEQLRKSPSEFPHCVDSEKITNEIL